MVQGLVHLIPQDIWTKLHSGQKSFRIKFGCDPTQPDMHLGHVVVLEKIRYLQDLGHHLDFVIGDFTSQIGDPTGRNSARPKMSLAQATKNSETYLAQVFRFLDPLQTTVVFNSAWHGKMQASELLGLLSHLSVAQILAREDFAKRLENNTHIGLHELLYPFFQAYDSVALQSDLEMGGTDQLFNLCMGRELQKKLNMAQQGIITCDLLVGLDGVHKMSKSQKNTIDVTDTPEDIFGKVMSISDELMTHYYQILQNVFLPSLTGIKARDTKIDLAYFITEKLHNTEDAELARNKFFDRDNIGWLTPLRTDVDSEVITILDLIIRLKLLPNFSQTKQCIDQGAVSIDNRKITSYTHELQAPGEYLLRVGKKISYLIIITKLETRSIG